jgi:hypothetical protein
MNEAAAMIEAYPTPINNDRELLARYRRLHRLRANLHGLRGRLPQRRCGAAARQMHPQRSRLRRRLHDDGTRAVPSHRLRRQRHTRGVADVRAGLPQLRR